MIICTKEVSVGARKNAYNLLVEIGNAFVRFCGNAKGERGLFGVRIIFLSGLRKSVNKKKMLTVFSFLIQMPWSNI